MVMWQQQRSRIYLKFQVRQYIIHLLFLSRILWKMIIFFTLDLVRNSEQNSQVLAAENQFREHLVILLLNFAAIDNQGTFEGRQTKLTIDQGKYPLKISFHWMCGKANSIFTNQYVFRLKEKRKSGQKPGIHFGGILSPPLGIGIPLTP